MLESVWFACSRLKRKIACQAPRDVYVISYPKSGRTWLRALIGEYFSLRWSLPRRFMLARKIVPPRTELPRVRFSHDGAAMKSQTRYTQLPSDKQQYARNKVILLGRDVKDILVSAYFQATKRINVFEGDVSEFIATEEFGVLKVLRFYSIWLHNKAVPDDFLFISYEDLHWSPRKTLYRVLQFIGEKSLREDLLDQSIVNCSFSTMKKCEAADRYQKTMLRPTDNADQESYKVRRGKIGGYAEYLSHDDAAYIDAVLAEHGFDFAHFRA